MSNQNIDDKLPNKEEAFRMEDGRRFHNSENTKYFFPNDNDEMDRLHSQHFLVKDLWKSNYLAPVDNLLKDGNTKILDLGCGSGSWLVDMATEFSLPSFTGIDITPVVPRGIKPKNVEFIQGNVLEGLPFQDNSIDYVHQRFLASGVPSDKWQSLIDDIVRVLKPGGYLEILELNTKFENLGPSSQFIHEAMIKLATKKGIHIQVNEKLQSFLEANQQVEDIVRRDLKTPFGKSSGQIGERAVDNDLTLLNSLRQPLSKILNITPERIDELIGDMRKEMPEYETFAGTTRVYGRKKI